MIRNFGTISLWVDDFDAAVYFYQKVLGLKLITRPGEVPHFKVGDTMLVLVKGSFCPPADAFPVDFPQVTFQVDRLDTAVKTLKANGVDPLPVINERRDSFWITLRDPAGNLLELVEVRD